MAPGLAPSEFIERERKKLLELLQLDPDSVLDTLASRRLISEDEYEILEEISDSLKKTRKLLIVIQRKGEVSCQHFLQCLFSTFPEFATSRDLKQEFLKYENAEPYQCRKVGKNSKDTHFLFKKKPESPEVMVSVSEKENEDLEMSKYFTDSQTRSGDTAWLSGGNKEYGSAEVKPPPSADNVKYKVPAFIEYLQDGQRYEEPDDSLYLGKEEYLKFLGDSEDVESTVGGENCGNPENITYEEQEDSAYSESSESSDEGHNEDSGNKSLEEEKNTEERKKVFQDFLSCLNMDRNQKLRTDIVKKFSQERGGRWAPRTPGDFVWNFLIKVQALDVTARDPIFRQEILQEEREGELLTEEQNLKIQNQQAVDPLDVLCASLLCSDSALQREVMSNMYQCRFALPLILPDAEHNKSIFLLGAMGAVAKEQSAQSPEGPIRVSETPLLLTKMPVISFVRLGYCSFSKSRILNTLLSPAELESPKVFLHRDLPSLLLPRRISDGLVEVSWCFPGGGSLKENPSFFQSPVALANLHGDLESLGTQFGFLMDVSSAVFIFTDCLGEKEWNLLMILENSIEKCYFVLGPQARESEEVEIFRRTLKLKTSQLLFWEEEAEEAGKNIECLQAALQDVMSSSLRCVSLEDMALLARKLGIQVDQDFDNIPAIQTLPNEDSTQTVQTEEQQRLSSSKSSSEKPAEAPVREPGVRHEASQNLQGFLPEVTTHLEETSPLPTVNGKNLNKAFWKAPWVTGAHLWSEQRPKWFCPSQTRGKGYFQTKRDYSRGESSDPKYSQPQRFHSHERFLRFLSTAWGHHTNEMHGKPPRLISQHVQARPERPQSREALRRPGSGASQIGHFHSLGSQPMEAVGKPQPKQTCTQGTQLSKATGKLLPASSFNTHPQLQAGATHNPVRSAAWQEDRQEAPGGFSNLTFQNGAHPVSSSKFVSSSQLKSNHPKPSQLKHPQSHPSQPLPPHPKPSQTKLTQPQSSPAKCSPPRVTLSKSCDTQASKSKPPQLLTFQPKPLPQSFQSRPSQLSSFQSKPSQPSSFQSKPFKPPSFQPKPLPQSFQSRPSQLSSFQSKPSQPPSFQPKPLPQSFQSRPSQPSSFQSRPSHPQNFQTNTSQLQSVQPKSSQLQSFQSTASQPKSFQHKSSQFQTCQSKPQSQSSKSKPSQPQPFQSKPSQPQPFQSKPSQPQPFQSKPSQPQPFQSKPSQPQFSHFKSSQLQFFPFRRSQSHPSQHKPSQAQNFQSKSLQPQPFHSKISQLHSSQRKPSQASSSQYKHEHQSSQYKSSPLCSSQSKPSHSCFSQRKPSQHKPAQPKSAWTSSSQAKAHYPRAGPKRTGKY